MHRKTVLAMLAMALLGAGYWAGTSTGSSTVGATAQKWHCPMHPQYVSSRPGEAPCCGMRLEPVSETPAAPSSPAALPPGAIHLSPDQNRLAGIRLTEARITREQAYLRTSGRVLPDENRVYPLILKVEGSVRKIYPQAISGNFVTKGQPLIDIYSFDLISAQQAYIVAVDAAQRAKEMAGLQSTEQVEAKLIDGRYNLSSLGFTPAQIEEIGRTQKVYSTLTLRAPSDGYLLTRNVYPDTRLDRGAEMFRLVDLRRVWVMADVYQRSAGSVRPGQSVRILTEDNRLSGRVSDVLPQFDPSARTLKVRVEVDNPGARLRPEMLVEVDFESDSGPCLTVPASALVYSGTRQLVYVEADSGVYQPRPVQVGRRRSGTVEIVEGLRTGERVVTSGTFLIDSESRIRQTTAPQKVTDPVCNMTVDASKPGVLFVHHQQHTYYFCSKSCRQSFVNKPAAYLTKLSANEHGE